MKPVVSFPFAYFKPHYNIFVNITTKTAASFKTDFWISGQSLKIRIKGQTSEEFTRSANVSLNKNDLLSVTHTCLSDINNFKSESTDPEFNPMHLWVYDDFIFLWSCVTIYDVEDVGLIIFVVSIDEAEFQKKRAQLIPRLRNSNEEPGFGSHKCPEFG